MEIDHLADAHDLINLLGEALKLARESMNYDNPDVPDVDAAIAQYEKVTA